MPNLSSEISKWLHELVERHADIREIWLLGSRANGTANPDSDWDFLVLGGPTLHAALRADTHIHRQDVDILVLDDTTRDFSSAWGDQKCGSLGGWEWTLENDSRATYKATKSYASPDDDDIRSRFPGSNPAQLTVSRANAFRVFSESSK